MSGDASIISSGNSYVGGYADVERIVKCVNACAGIEDPAAEIKRLREALAQGIESLQSFVDDTRDPGTGALCALHMMRRALGFQPSSPQHPAANEISATIGHQENRAMVAWSRSWRIDGDLCRCRDCRPGILLSRMNEAIIHTADCPQKHFIAPWQDLRSRIPGNVDAKP